MKLSNGLFAQAVQWIFENTEIKDQKTLSVFTGITETTISRILNDKVKRPSVDTIQKLNDAFDGLFNLAYFSGASVVLLNADAAYFKQHPEKSPLHKATIPESSGSVVPSDIPAWADSLIHLVSENTKVLETLLKENAAMRKDVAAMRAEIKQLRADFGAALHHPAIYNQEQEPLPMAAESSSNNK